MPKIKEKDLIKRLKGITHLARLPIKKLNNKITPQLYILGYNAGGRPDGMWFSCGGDWLKFTTTINNSHFPPCCFIYDAKIYKSKLLQINNYKDFKKLDKEVSSYWINFDYFDVNFADVLNNQIIQSNKIYDIDFEELYNVKQSQIKKYLVEKKLIFLSAKDALTYCEFYNNIDIPIERFKLKDWNSISHKYNGIVFNYYNKKDLKTMKYFWYKSLDVESICIWNPRSIISLKLDYYKISENEWIKIK